MQNIDGLWTVEGLPLEVASSGGILVFCRGQVLGGGDRYYCIGAYSLKITLLEMEVRVFHFLGAVYSGVAGNKPDFHLHFRGAVLTELIEGHVNSVDDRAAKVPLKLVWRAPLRL
jgi:hypothetical protein